MLKKLGLIISPVSPYPTDQGNRIRLREVCENIAAIDNTAVDFLLFPLDFNPKADLFTVKKRLQRVFRDVLIGPYYERWHTPPLDNCRHSIDEWISEEMKSFTRSLLSKHKYDFVIVNYVFFSGLLDLFPCSTFKIIDSHGTSGTNNITVARNGSKIQGATSDLTISTNRAAIALVFYDSDNGWLLKYND